MVPKPSIEKKRKEEIVNAALRCFSKRGYHGTTTEQIAAEAGFSKGLVYYYYDSKQQIFLAGLSSWLARFDRFLQEALVSGSAEQKIRRLVSLTADATEQSSDFLNVFLEFWARAGREENLMNILNNVLSLYRDHVADVIQEGITNGEFYQVDPKLTAVGLVAAIDGLWMHWLIDRQAFSVQRASDELVENLLSGMKIG